MRELLNARDTRPPESEPVLLFDGECNLCSATVRFVLERDCRERLKFASLQSEVGLTLLAKAGMPSDPDDAGEQTLVLIEGDRAWVRSAGALRVASMLCGAWPLLGIFRIVPAPLRDLVYRWVARNRFLWFGRRDACYVSSGDVRARFLDADSGNLGGVPAFRCMDDAAESRPPGRSGPPSVT